MKDLVQRLGVTLAARPARRVERPEARRAAVAVLVTSGADPAILFIRRKERAGDPWSGQMAFPGGFTSSSDASLEATSLRETEEETGLPPHAARPLGALDEVSPRTPYLPPLIITPYVFGVDSELATRPGPEVEATVWLKVRDLFDPARRRPYRLTFRAAAGEGDGRVESREFESIVIGSYVIWGLTERVLQQLGELAAL